MVDRHEKYICIVLKRRYFANFKLDAKSNQAPTAQHFPVSMPKTEKNREQHRLMDSLDAALDSCNRLAMVGDLLRAVSQPAGLSNETLRFAGDLIEGEAARLRTTVRTLAEERKDCRGSGDTDSKSD